MNAVTYIFSKSGGYLFFSYPSDSRTPDEAPEHMIWKIRYYIYKVIELLYKTIPEKCSIGVYYHLMQELGQKQAEQQNKKT